MPLTLRDVLELDAIRRGEPRVAAGSRRLAAVVRWVHAAELPDVGRLLRGGELLLSTGIALPDSADALAAYIASLAAAGVTGLAIELGHRFTALPAPLVAAAAAHELPLIELRREVPFVEITEAVHARIIDELLIERAAAALALGRLLTSQAESLERQAHRTLISAIIDRAGADPAGAAEARARAMGVPVTGRTLVAAVVRLPDTGLGTSGGPAAVLGVADAVAAGCRTARVPALVGALDDVRAAALLSLPPGGDPDGPLRVIAARLAAYRGGHRTASLTGLPGTEPGQSGEAGDKGDQAETGERGRPVIGVGTPTGSLPGVRAAFLEAREVADVAIRQAMAGLGQPRPGRGHGDGQDRDRGYYRLPDLRLRGLVHVLRDDPRLRAFADRELGPLLAYDAAHGTALAGDLAAYLEAGGNKVLAAQRAHLARPTFYQRLQVIERVLGVSLADPESRASLHVALLARVPPDGPGWPGTEVNDRATDRNIRSRE